MANLIKYKVLKEPGAIFASAITTDYIELSNNKEVHFIVATGAGTEGDTTVKVKAKLGADGEAKAISFKEKIGQTTYSAVTKEGKTLTIGGTAGECGYAIYTVNADSLKGEYDRVALDLTAVSESTVPGSIVAAIIDARYSE